SPRASCACATTPGTCACRAFRSCPRACCASPRSNERRVAGPDAGTRTRSPGRRLGGRAHAPRRAAVGDFRDAHSDHGRGLQDPEALHVSECGIRCNPCRASRHRPYPLREPRQQRAQDEPCQARARARLEGDPARARRRLSRLLEVAFGAAAVLKQADALIVLGERWREFFVSVGVAPERIAVLPNPVALPARVPRRAPGERTVFAYLGLIAGHKGSFDLVDAVARLAPATRKRLRVVVAGNGAGAELERRVATHGLEDCFEVRGWIGAAERDALLAAAEVFVLPSDHEGLPMSLLEAMAWGLAPLCTPVGAIPE